MQQYVEMTIDEAKMICNRGTKVLVAVQDLEKKEDTDIVFIQRKREDYDKIFEDVKTIVSHMDSFVKQLRCFTESQDIYNIKPLGVQKIVLVK